MEKSEFLETEKRYYGEKKRFQNIKPGDLVWGGIPRGGDMDYHPAVVKSVNEDENYIDVIDVSSNNE